MTKKTKIIALLPFKNEEYFLQTYTKSMDMIADELVAINDGSTDNSVEIIKANAKNMKVNIIDSDNQEEWVVDKIRQQLLNIGREKGGTHFICLDADECFTQQFIPIGRKIMERMEPGHKIVMQWLAMWKSTDHYKDDHTVWSNNYKDFIFCDDGVSNHGDAYLCEPRTPGENTEENNLKLNNKYGAVMHFQFSAWQKFQIKQSWYRCREAVVGKHPAAINEKYRITLDDPNSVVSACPETWMPERPLPGDLSILDYSKDWHLKEIEKMFKEHGIGKFKDLNIWHVQQIREIAQNVDA